MVTIAKTTFYAHKSLQLEKIITYVKDESVINALKERKPAEENFSVL
jgi:hypothetical protein